MKDSGVGQSRSAPFVIRSNDIVFECPKCGKNLAADQDAESLTVHCPQCSTEVIVPPKSSAAPAPSPAYQTHMTAPPPPPPVEVVQGGAERRAAVQMTASPPPTPMEEQPETTQVKTQYLDTAVLHSRLVTLSAQIKEIQHQRASLIARMMIHIDEANRILEQLGGLQGIENETHREWNNIRGKITAARQTGDRK